LRLSQETYGFTHAHRRLTDKRETATVLDALGKGFHQRVFTEVLRDKERVKVGLPPHAFLFWKKGDVIKKGAVQHAAEKDTWRRITGEALSPPVWADLHAGQSTRGQQGVSPLDAAVAITNGGVGLKTEVVDDPRPPAERKPLRVEKRTSVLALSKETIVDGKELDRVTGLVLQAWKQKVPPLNDEEGKAREVCGVFEDAGPGKLRIRRSETPDEARLRWQHQQTEDSYHSAIVSNPNHSRYVTTYDLAIGAPIPATHLAAKFRIYLCEVADWRREDPAVSMLDADRHTKIVMDFFNQEDGKNKALIEATGLYYKKGIIPAQVLNAAIPGLVKQDTVGDRNLRAAVAYPTHGLD
jgi:hypothetical protein